MIGIIFSHDTVASLYRSLLSLSQMYLKDNPNRGSDPSILVGPIVIDRFKNCETSRSAVLLDSGLYKYITRHLRAKRCFSDLGSNQAPQMERAVGQRDNSLGTEFSLDEFTLANHNRPPSFVHKSKLHVSAPVTLSIDECFWYLEMHMKQLIRFGVLSRGDARIRIPYASRNGSGQHQGSIHLIFDKTVTVEQVSIVRLFLDTSPWNLEQHLAAMGPSPESN